MKIVLREHVEHLGDRGDIVTVAPGYARNYLLPKLLAFPATAGNMQMLEHQRRVFDARQAKEIDEAQAMAQRLAELKLSVTKKAGESGTLYGSVTTSEIAELLRHKGIEVDRRRLITEHPIKTVGIHPISMKLHHAVTGVVRLEVKGEQVASSVIEEPPEPDEVFEE